MLSFRKYLKVFTNATQETLQYRVNFLFGRINNFVILLTMYFLWSNIFTDPSSVFFGFSKPDIITYVMGASVLYSVVFVQAMNPIAFEIADGDLSNYLVKPIKYFSYWFSRNNAERMLFLAMSIIEIWIVSFLIDRSMIVVQHNFFQFVLFIVALVAAVVTYQIIDFLLGTTAFWFYKSFGPRFAIQTTIMLTSGYLFPISVLPSWLRIPLELTPFPYLVNFPVQLYLGKLSATQMGIGFGVLACWVVVLYVAYRILWEKGLKVFEGAGR